MLCSTDGSGTPLSLPTPEPSTASRTGRGGKTPNIRTLVRTTGSAWHRPPVSCTGGRRVTTGATGGGRHLARVWVEGRRRRCPLDGLEVLNASRHTDRINRSIFGALDSPRPSWCLSLSPPPPLPLSPYNLTCPNTLPTNGRVFLWSPGSPSPSRFPLAPDPSTS